VYKKFLLESFLRPLRLVVSVKLVTDLQTHCCVNEKQCDIF